MKNLLILQLPEQHVKNILRARMNKQTVYITLLLGIQIPFQSLFPQANSAEPIHVLDKKYNYYMLEPKDSIKGILILFPGKGENPKDVFRKTKIPAVLRAKGYSTIVPALPYSLFADNSIKTQLKEILRVRTGDHKLIAPNLILGGYSAGGSVAISFAEYLLSFDSMPFLKAIFVIDPPLDLERFYATAQKFVQYDCGRLIYKEGAETLDFLEGALGTPTESFKNYFLHSPFLASESDGGNARFLKSVPIRLYCEPDIEYVQRKYCRQLKLEDLNVTDLEKLNQVLIKLGNKNAEYIVTKGKGYHNWNIVDPDDLADWILRFEK